MGPRGTIDRLWPADPSIPADVLGLGERLVECMLGVYAAEAMELETDRGEALRCTSPVDCDIGSGTQLEDPTG